MVQGGANSRPSGPKPATASSEDVRISTDGQVTLKLIKVMMRLRRRIRTRIVSESASVDASA